MSGSSIVHEVVPGRALRGNPLGDPVERALPVYLPPGYAEEGPRYPTVYLLASFPNRGEAYLQRRAWQESVQERMDRLIREGGCRPMILAMPDCTTRYGGSQYLNSSATGNYRDYLLEVVETVDARFRTLPEPAARAAVGHSSGGYGALAAGMDHPNVFGLVADHSGDKYFEWCYKPELPRFLDVLAGFDDLHAVLADPGAVRPQGNAFHTLMNVCAMSACYSPNDGSALGFDLPVDPQTGALRPEVWARWLVHDPVQRVETRADALRSLRLLYLDCGRRDQYFLHYGCRIFSHKLAALGIRHVYQEFDDDHFSIHYRLDVSLAAISASMLHDRGAGPPPRDA